ncbi:MAG: UbiA prenyltransferase family protein [Planctomycetota bacterium]
MAAILRLMRPGDWTKNVFVLIAPMFWLARELAQGDKVELGTKSWGIFVAFASFCLVASGSYCINDAIDAPQDRGHPVKRRRPVAAGEVSAPFAIGLGVALIGAAIGLASTVRIALVLSVLAYIALQAAYNLALKRVAILDITTIAAGFGLRAAAGALAIGVSLSVWLVLCVFFLCLFLGFIKRTCDLVRAAQEGSSWRSSAGYGDPAELNLLIAMSATLTVVMYVSYTLSPHAIGIFGPRAYGMALLTPLVLAVIHRFWRRANRGLSDSPLAALREDRVVLACVGLFALLLGVILFSEQAKWALEMLFQPEDIA